MAKPSRTARPAPVHAPYWADGSPVRVSLSYESLGRTWVATEATEWERTRVVRYAFPADDRIATGSTPVEAAGSLTAKMGLAGHPVCGADLLSIKALAANGMPA